MFQLVNFASFLLLYFELINARLLIILIKQRDRLFLIWFVVNLSILVVIFHFLNIFLFTRIININLIVVLYFLLYIYAPS